MHPTRPLMTARNTGWTGLTESRTMVCKLRLPYEKKSLVLTTNLAFAEWHPYSPVPPARLPSSNASCITPTSSKIEGERYRLRESQLEAASRGKLRETKPKA